MTIASSDKARAVVAVKARFAAMGQDPRSASVEDVQRVVESSGVASCMADVSDRQFAAFVREVRS